jgi:hypothetical protein
MKTLGIKFQVAGVKEAQAALNNFKNSLNRFFVENKKLASEATSNNFINSKNTASSADVSSSTNISVSIDDKSLEQQTTGIQSAIKTGFKDFNVKFKKAYNPVENILIGYQEAIGGHFGAKAGQIIEKLFNNVFDFSFIYKNGRW